MDLAISNTQKRNDRNSPISYHNNAIVNSENSVHSFGKDEDIQRKTFSQFIKENNLSYIDYLKIDIEGAEYDVFTEENIDYLKNNVMFIAAEFHLNYEGNREKWKHFRDNYLWRFPNYKIVSCTTQNIVPGEMIDLEKYLSADEFVDSYGCQFMVYINNDKSHP